MSTYVPGYQHDIFVSYAPVDDEPLIGAETGWITTLLNGLKVSLNQKLGRQNAFSLWQDTLLGRNTPITLERAKQLENVATLLLILSPAYLESSHCLTELRTFVNKVGNEAGRIFVVEYDAVEPRPEELSDLLGYRFWEADVAGRQRTLGIPKPHPDKDYNYYQQLDYLCDDVSKKLKYLKTQIKTASVTVTEAISSGDNLGGGKYTIFLAEVPDDLTLRREEVKRNLESQGVRILPDKLYYFPSPEALQQAIDADLKTAAVFVQLLSASLPQRPPGMSTPPLQYDRAQSLGVPMLQWRDRTLETDTVQDPALRALLTGSTVRATGILEFQQHILQFLKKLEADNNTPKVPANQSDGSLVFIDAELKDIPLAHQLENLLCTSGLGCSLPMEIAERVF